MSITIFAARRVHTMNPGNPLATHVAVRDGQVLGAGTLDEVAGSCLFFFIRGDEFAKLVLLF